MRFKNILAAALWIIAAGSMAAAGPPLPSPNELFLHETFDHLQRWEVIRQPKMVATAYKIEKENKNKRLAAHVRGSYSMLRLRQTFDLKRYPKMRWRWKVENIYPSGDGRTRKGDDFPIRLGLVFQYDPKKAGMRMKAAYGMAKALKGKYPPHCGLSYVWANRIPKGEVIPNPYTERSIQIVRQSGSSKTGIWIEETAEPLKDYLALFGEQPPDVATIVILSDGDNTGESARAYLDDLEIFAEPGSSKSAN